MTELGTIVGVLQDREVFIQVTSPGFIGTIVIGLLAGWIAGTVTRGHGFRCIVNVLLGLIGAFIGRWIFLKLGIVIWGFFGMLAAATVGAVLLVAVARLLAGSRGD
ncbi:MAG TPA: GlsB/YeaQ/YmgE family stress response membrane protein [Candidatus Limnocylindrales bacterium]|nr:GlsB/YeaQ/YmgE family stress response membrane protein [Candidatus Limnocylindrales bacterium]